MQITLKLCSCTQSPFGYMQEILELYDVTYAHSKVHLTPNAKS